MKRQTPFAEWSDKERERKRERERELYRQRQARAGHLVVVQGEGPGPLGRWIDHAACADKTLDLDPLIFWPPADRPERPGEVQLFLEQRQMARLCGPCPVRDECLDDARRNRFTGTWGGVLRREVKKAGVAFSEHDLIATHERLADTAREKAA